MRLPFLDRLWRKDPPKDPGKPKYAPRRRRVLVTEEDDDGSPPVHRGFLSDSRSRFTLIAAIVAIVVTAAVMLIERRLAATATDADAERPAQVALGRGLYRQQCSYCHGSDREGHEDWRPDTPVASGLGPPLDERSPAVERSDRQSTSSIFTPAAPQPVANPSYGQPQNYPNQNYPQQSYPQNQPVYPSGAPQFPQPGQNNSTQTPPSSQPAWPR